MKLITTLFLLLSVCYVFSQPALEWEHEIGGAFEDHVIAVHTDDNGNVLVTGYFKGTIDFDPGVGVFNLSSNSNDQELFLLKLDPLGNFLWAFNLGDGGNTKTAGHDIKTNSNGDIFITGKFEGNVDFDPGVGSTLLTSDGFTDVFIAKYTSTGALTWAKKVGGSSFDFGSSINIDPNGNIIVTGNYAGTVDFDPGAATSNLSSGGANADVFILKLDSNGDYLWAKSFGDWSSIAGYSAIDSQGNIYTVGKFLGTIDFDLGAGVFNLSSPTYLSSYILKLDSNGDFLWAGKISSSYNQEATSCAIDNDDNLILTGWFGASADFDIGGGTQTMSSNGLTDPYTLKLDPQGGFIWVNTSGYLGGTSDEYGQGVAVDNSNNVYSYYNYSSSLNRIKKIDVNGATEWDINAHSGYYASTEPDGNSIDVQGANIYTGGEYTSASADLFVQKWSICQPSTNSITETACGSYTAPDGQVHNSSGQYTAIIPNAAGCDSVITIDLTINTVDATTTQVDGITIQANLNGAQYQWVDCDNNFSNINGETNQTYVASVNGNYAVIVTDGNCSDTSDCVSVNSVGLSEILSDHKVLVKIIDLMGRESGFKYNTPLIYIYSDGTRERIIEVKN